MVEGTRAQGHRRLEDSVQQLKETSDQQAMELKELSRMMTAINLKLDQLAGKSADLGTFLEGGGFIPTKRQTGFNLGLQSTQMRFSKLNFPTFEGENPSGWLYKCERCFKYNGVEESDMLGLATIHLEGKALEWFQGYEAAVQTPNWKQFSADLIDRFGPGIYDNSVGQLTKLRQTTIVRSYQEQFEGLMARTRELPEEFFVQCFMSGLKDVIKNQVAMFQSKTLIQAFGLALLQEGNMEAVIKETKASTRTPLTQSAPLPEVKRNSTGALPPIKRISHAEMLARRDKKLCYYCDEKFEPRHKCKRRQIYLLEGDDEEDIDDQEMTTEDQQEESLVSLYALAGAASHQTMRITVNIKKGIIILIDSGSTHNFLDVLVAKHTGCVVQQDKPLTITVADGSKIVSTATCKHLAWSMQGKEFRADMRLIPLGGCDMVLGIQWLSQLSPVLWNFKNLWMEFKWEGRRVVLRGSTVGPLKLVSAAHIEKDLKQVPHVAAAPHLFINGGALGQTEREFKVEVEAIGRVRHKNLVRLLGYCIEGAHRMLVFEYVDNGNLEQWLHGDVGLSSLLTWEIRMNIMLGTAKGLTYLHEGLEPKVVHHDIKSSNILLGKQWNPKVSDFSLAKLLGSERSYVTTCVMGTFGYVAPEYASTGMLSERSDVYSFGVLIMEIISGRNPVDYSRPAREVNMVEWLKTMVTNRNAERVLDPRLPEKPSSKALKRALLVALRCVDPNAQKMPKMGHVIHMLEADEFPFRDDRKAGRHNGRSQREDTRERLMGKIVRESGDSSGYESGVQT